MRVEKIPARGKEYEFKVGLADVNGQSIQYGEMGEGELVILVHGFPECWQMWVEQMIDLADKGYHAVAIDTRGVGGSSNPDGFENYTTDKLATDVAELVPYFGKEKAYLIGHDWGAIISWTAAWMYPERFYGILGFANCFGGRNVLALPFSPDASKKPSDIQLEISGEDMIFYSAKFAELDVALVEMRAARNWLLNSFYGWSHLLPPHPKFAEVKSTELTDEQMKEVFRTASVCTPRYVENPAPVEAKVTLDKIPFLPEYYLNQIIENWDKAGLEHSLYYYKAADLTWEIFADKEPRITIPARFVGGDRDWATIWARDAIHDLESRCDDFRGTRIIENCGHWSVMEYPEEITKEIIDFIESI